MPRGVLRVLFALLLLSLLPLLQAGDLSTMDSMSMGSCINAKKLCLADSTCSGPFLDLESCFPFTASAPPKPENQEGCLEAAQQLQNNSLGSCRCQWRMKNQVTCLAIYWTIHSTYGLGDYDLGGSPYKEIVISRPLKFNHLDLFESGSVSQSSPDLCLKSTTLCTLNDRCNKLRLAYGEVCSVARCQPLKCQQELRVFFEQVAEHYAQALLFCPCDDGDDVCGARRRNTIAPSCASPTRDPPNCLMLWETCLQDVLCRSRLADFQMHCHTDPLGTCMGKQPRRCLKAYMGLIGTVMTPNYISNLSADVAVSCSCRGSGNQLEECKRIQESFSSNPCLTKAIKAQMQFHRQLLSKSSSTAVSQDSFSSYSVDTDQVNNPARRLRPWVPTISLGSLTLVLLLHPVLGHL
ncbi:GDNF family receptor alpha-3 isoform X2 [Dromiciops gliroides]|uniref:GDNF family receptor alpha-3 isoform X2 n=1 Tax=Dromiciops gliroides TaxID=33562 RepID=UPI001CC5F212|nr:GDNF family receptor alpha-3 isoform X2 [Dromiciops gliroides]